MAISDDEKNLRADVRSELLKKIKETTTLASNAGLLRDLADAYATVVGADLNAEKSRKVQGF